MSEVFILVGVPGSGKSYYAENNLMKLYPDAVYIASDYFIDKFARRTKQTYNDVFDYFINKAIKLMMRRISKARKKNKTIIWDQTSGSVYAREKKLNALHKYTAIAIVFETPPEDILQERLNARQGKSIPDYVMKSMISNLTFPTFDEGFTEIRHVKTF